MTVRFLKLLLFAYSSIQIFADIFTNFAENKKKLNSAEFMELVFSPSVLCQGALKSTKKYQWSILNINIFINILYHCLAEALLRNLPNIDVKCKAGVHSISSQ